jgi:hypothetical protein
MSSPRQMEQVYWYCLAYAAKLHGVLVHAACLMSTHCHEVITDVRGDYPRFLQTFQKPINCKAGTMENIIQFVAIILVALSMGVHFGTWLTERPIRRTQSGALFTEVHQGRDAVAARVMPILGNSAILFVAFGVFLARHNPTAFVLALTGLCLVISDMAVTLRFNVPINKEIQTWRAEAPPAEWKHLRDRWERFHTIRTMLIVPGFALYTASVVFF